MKILIIANQEVFQIVNQLRQISKSNWELVVPSCAEKSLEFYNSSDFDMLIIEIKYAALNNIPIQEHISKVNPSQKVITIGDGIIGCNDEKCDKCVENYHYRRVIVPLDIKELFHTIISFDKVECRQFKCLEHIDKLIPVILRKHPALTFDLDNTSIIYDKLNSYNFSVVDFYGLYQELQEYNVSCEYISDEVIKINCHPENK